MGIEDWDNSVSVEELSQREGVNGRLLMMEQDLKKTR